MLISRLIIIVTVFAMGCSCSTSRVNSTEQNKEPVPTVPTENNKTERDGVVKGEMQDVVSKPAMVESIKIYIKESFPVQVDVYATGYLPDGCTKISDEQIHRDGGTFKVTIMTERPAHILCTQALVPFEHQVALDVLGLKAGTYTVNVNDVRDTFTLEIDNVMTPGE